MPPRPTVVFVCEHGAAKSVIAATYLPQIARKAGLDLRALARGTDPEPTLMAAAVEGLRIDGIAVPDHSPARPSDTELATAAVVVSFGPDLTDVVPADVPYRVWPDIPAVSVDYEVARSEIVAQVADLIAELRA